MSGEETSRRPGFYPRFWIFTTALVSTANLLMAHGWALYFTLTERPHPPRAVASMAVSAFCLAIIWPYIITLAAQVGGVRRWIRGDPPPWTGKQSRRRASASDFTLSRAEQRQRARRGAAQLNWTQIVVAVISTAGIVASAMITVLGSE